jgi:hypothetical protein
MPTPVDDADLTLLPGWERLPADVQATFVEAHLPASFLKREGGANFLVGPQLVEVDVPSLGRLLRFGHGTSAFNGDFCLNQATGDVYLVMPRNQPVFVNSSLDQLAQTTRLVLPLAPEFTTGDADACQSAALRIRRGIERIDEPAADPDSYWGTISYDIEAGEYSSNPDF